MRIDIPPSIQAIQNAQDALRNGNKREARRWAELAASLAPDLEEPWLVLAAVASPRASVAYLEQALMINPDSERAIKGLNWAHKRLPRLIEQATQPTQPIQHPVYIAKSIPQKEQVSADYTTVLFGCATAAVIIFAFVVAIGLIVWPGNISHVQAFIALNPPVSAPMNPNTVLSGKITATITNTGTPVPPTTVTITPSPSYTPTSTATPTKKPTRKPTQVKKQPAVQPDSSGGKKHILVDISDQRMYAYEGDELIYNFVVSTGRNGGTLSGNFKILDKIPKAYSASWGFWMPDWMGIYYVGYDLENGIHSLPVLTSGEEIWGDSLGSPVSYGCVVLGPEDAKRLFDWTDIGTPIEIRP